jgi:hypothetical protein
VASGGVSYDLPTEWRGVLAHHADNCPARYGRPCTCGPLGYRGSVEDPDRTAPIVGPPVGTVEGAQAWASEHEVAMESWRAASAQGDTVDELIADFLEAAASGQAVDQHGRPYEPDALDDMRWSLQGYVAGELGQMRIADVRGTELRRLVSRLDAGGLSAARTRLVVSSARALLRYAAQRGLVSWSAADTLVLGEEDGGPRHGATASQTAPIMTAPQPMIAPQPMTVSQPTLVAEPGLAAAPAGYVPDTVIWLILKIVAIVFALIALVLVAESV